MHDFWLVLPCEPSFPSAVKGLWCPYLYSLVQVGLSPVTIKLNRIPFQICFLMSHETERIWRVSPWHTGVPVIRWNWLLSKSYSTKPNSTGKAWWSCKLNIFISFKMKFKVAIFLKYFINVSYRGCPKLYWIMSVTVLYCTLGIDKIGFNSN